MIGRQLESRVLSPFLNNKVMIPRRCVRGSKPSLKDNYKFG